MQTISRPTFTIVTKEETILPNEAAFASWTLEDLYTAVKQHTQAKWINLFFDRYLDIGKLEQIL